MEDTAWHPAGKAELEKWGVVQRTLFKIFLGSPLKLWASVGHWALWHFDLSLYTDKQKPRVSPSASLSPCLYFRQMTEEGGPCVSAASSWFWVWDDLVHIASVKASQCAAPSVCLSGISQTCWAQTLSAAAGGY